MSVAGPSAQKPPLTFEFTKRKRWADLLIKELADAVIFILSPTCKVLYCGTAVTELLGWRDEELIDGDLMDLINVDDQAVFQDSFEESVRTGCDLLSYVRLKCKYDIPIAEYPSPKYIVFELKGYPHFVQDENIQDCKCVFTVAKPYPSRNAAMLNTFLELKTENERLQRRVLDLRASNMVSMALPMTAAVPSNYPASTSALTTAIPPQAHPNPVIASSQRPVEAINTYYTALGQQAGYGEMLTSSVRQNFDGLGGVYGSLPASLCPEEDSSEDGQRKKKLKKTHPSEYICVTCGRTDSPEWRKGPSGPKTLCNACGLRWAKQMRKIDDPEDTGLDIEASGVLIP